MHWDHLDLVKDQQNACVESLIKVVAFGFGFQISELGNLPLRDEQNTI